MNDLKKFGISLMAYGLIHIAWIIAISFTLDAGFGKYFWITYMVVATIFFFVWGLLVYKSTENQNE